MATRKFSSKRTSTAPAAPAPSLPLLAHERQAEAREAIVTIEYGCRLVAALMRAPNLEQESLVCGIEITSTVRALVASMEDAAGRIVKLLLLEAKDAEAKEAAMRG